MRTQSFSLVVILLFAGTGLSKGGAACQDQRQARKNSYGECSHLPPAFFWNSLGAKSFRWRLHVCHSCAVASDV